MVDALVQHQPGRGGHRFAGIDREDPLAHHRVDWFALWPLLDQVGGGDEPDNDPEPVDNGQAVDTQPEHQLAGTTNRFSRPDAHDPADHEVADGQFLRIDLGFQGIHGTT